MTRFTTEERAVNMKVWTGQKMLVASLILACVFILNLTTDAKPNIRSAYSKKRSGISAGIKKTPLRSVSGVTKIQCSAICIMNGCCQLFSYNENVCLLFGETMEQDKGTFVKNFPTFYFVDSDEKLNTEFTRNEVNCSQTPPDID
ncbi:uncharacterized protein LOC143248368 [Tachypleus tridentatus]|uniref:uncharacterized protein LOC143248368 n=1 Tax=Tachypleus tridentatus TaxID=6853 RepID=UPI003FD1DC43